MIYPSRSLVFSYSVTSSYRNLSAYKRAFYCAINANNHTLARRLKETHDALESDLNALLDAIYA